MITLSDINGCQINEKKVLQAYSRDSYIMEVVNENQTISTFKYDDFETLHDDIAKINEASTTYVLCG